MGKVASPPKESPKATGVLQQADQKKLSKQDQLF